MPQSRAEQSRVIQPGVVSLSKNYHTTTTTTTCVSSIESYSIQCQLYHTTSYSVIQRCMRSLGCYYCIFGEILSHFYVRQSSDEALSIPPSYLEIAKYTRIGNQMVPIFSSSFIFFPVFSLFFWCSEIKYKWLHLKSIMKGIHIKRQWKKVLWGHHSIKNIR